jgi:hypothetical protein
VILIEIICKAYPRLISKAYPGLIQGLSRATTRAYPGLRNYKEITKRALFKELSYFNIIKTSSYQGPE